MIGSLVFNLDPFLRKNKGNRKTTTTAATTAAATTAATTTAATIAATTTIGKEKEVERCHTLLQNTTRLSTFFSGWHEK